MHLYLKRLTPGLEKLFCQEVVLASVRHPVKNNRKRWFPILSTSDNTQNYCSSLKPIAMARTEHEGLPLAVVVKKLKQFAPISLAESWDNVGLLIEPVKPKDIKRILLTNDLTEEVMEEAVEKGTDLIISYHPPIFAPLKSVTNKTWKERLVATCLENKIAVYSPHTSFDSLSGGVNDWLASAFKTKELSPIVQTSKDNSLTLEFSYPAKYVHREKVTEVHTKWMEAKGEDGGTLVSQLITDTEDLKFMATGDEALMQKLCDIITSTLLPSKAEDLKETPVVKMSRHGVGRICILENSLTLEEVVVQVKKHINKTHLNLAIAVGKDLSSLVSNIAICAGSGTSVLRGVKADLYLTGEMSHHDILDATHNGTHVILCNHSDSERGFLVPFSRLLGCHILEEKVQVDVSQRDRDPLTTV